MKVLIGVCIYILISFLIARIVLRGVKKAYGSTDAMIRSIKNEKLYEAWKVNPHFVQNALGVIIMVIWPGMFFGRK